MNDKPLLPITIIHFDPVRRCIVQPAYHSMFEPYTEPLFFDISKVFRPADRIAFRPPQEPTQ